MSENEEPEVAAESAPESTSASPKPETDGPQSLPRRKKLLLALAAVFVSIGVCMNLFASGGEPADPVAKSGEPGLVTPGNLVPGQPGPDGTVAAAGEEVPADTGLKGWSPFFVKGGMSFLVAFCVGFALRTFLRLTAIFFGLFFLVLFGLSYIDIVIVDWSAIDGYFNGFVGRVGEEAQHFKTFITGSLPSVGLATAGLVTGFKR